LRSSVNIVSKQLLTEEPATCLSGSSKDGALTSAFKGEIMFLQEVYNYVQAMLATFFAVKCSCIGPTYALLIGYYFLHNVRLLP
jgi:hypothetical protein